MSISIAWLALALTTAVLSVVAFLVTRTGTVAGPTRVPHEPGALRALTLVMLVGFSAWLVIPGFAALAVQGTTAATGAPATAPTNGPATAPVFTPQQGVLIGVIAGAGAAAVLIGANVLVRPGGLRGLGFSLAHVPRGVAVGLVAALLVLPLTFVAGVVTDKFWQVVGLEHPGVHEMLEILGGTTAPSLRVLIYASAILVAPVFEELLFRGHIQTLLVSAFARVQSPAHASDQPAPEPSPQPPPIEPPAQPVLEYAPPPTRAPSPPGPGARWLAIGVTSVLFALVHGALWMMPPIFFLSLCLGYLYERTGNLWGPISLHLLFNLVNVAVFVNMFGR
jgi:membrane protease YdiL (CAAX protease family)